MPEPLKPTEVGFGTPWADQIAFLRDKLQLPSEQWDDLQKGANDKAFIVTGAKKADLVNDLHQAVLTTAEAGGGERDFQKQFEQIVAKHGWTGWTGEGSKAGTAWRAGIIYQTNMATSYAAGRWRQLMEPGLRQRLPFWRYHHADGVAHPRPLHLAWNGVTLRWDHPFWQTHFCPNGWRCHCWVDAVAKPGPGDKTEPPAGWDKVSEVTGAPVGIDRGWDYAPGAARHLELQTFIDAKLLRLDGPMGDALRQYVKPVLGEQPAKPVAAPAPAAATQVATEFVARALQAPRDKQPPHPLAPVADTTIALADALGLDLRGKLIALDHDGVIHTMNGHAKANERLRGQEPITALDLALLGLIVNGAELRLGDPPRARDGTAVLEGEAVLDGWLYQFALRVRKRFVVLQTLFKRRKKENRTA